MVREIVVLVGVLAVMFIVGTASFKEKRFTMQHEKRAKKELKYITDPVAKIKNDDLDELSGLVPSSIPNSFWGHNDKGNDAELFRFNLDGDIQQRVILKGIPNIDWEAMTCDESGNFFIGDIGDNDEGKSSYFIHQLAEPDQYINTLHRDNVITYRFRYSDLRPHNCESLFYYNNSIYGITKVTEYNRRSKLFVFEALDRQSLNIAKIMGELLLNEVITDASYSVKYNILAVLTYSGVALYSMDEIYNVLSLPDVFIDGDFGQCEGITFQDHRLIVSNEGGKLWIIEVGYFLRYFEDG